MKSDNIFKAVVIILFAAFILLLVVATFNTVNEPRMKFVPVGDEVLICKTWDGSTHKPHKYTHWKEWRCIKKQVYKNDTLVGSLYVHQYNKMSQEQYSQSSLPTYINVCPNCGGSVNIIKKNQK